ncbi:hypothetical protein LNKW23_20120 [Paralimibaculum aggregatum]|uniref:Uncharacterized protein n=1 Tax=Paralimibaculum aggregatum TaxID=3036245 RepID=A0ABQ6LPW7_9RHOB|nr:hypothetical protein LNKW23_20120 [Limibaculum sp. NKW23]
MTGPPRAKGAPIPHMEGPATMVVALEWPCSFPSGGARQGDASREGPPGRSCPGPTDVAAQRRARSVALAGSRSGCPSDRSRRLRGTPGRLGSPVYAPSLPRDPARAKDALRQAVADCVARLGESRAPFLGRGDGRFLEARTHRVRQRPGPPGAPANAERAGAGIARLERQRLPPVPAAPMPNRATAGQ